MQAISVPRLDSEQLWTAVEDIDPMAVVTEQLLGTTAISATPATAPVLLDAGHSALTATSLRALRTATLATLAARELLEPGLITGCVLGSGLALQAHLTVSTRYLADISHVAMCRTDRRGPLRIGSRLADRLDLAGIDWSVTDDLGEAVLGANLVLVTDAGPRLAEIGRLSAGALLVNASGRQLPAAMVKRVATSYVDDRTLLPANGLREHTTPGTGRVVAGDLCQLLAVPRRDHTRGESVLVDLLGGDVLDATLANNLYSAVMRRRLRIRTEFSA